MLRRILPDSQSVEWIDPSAKVALVERLVPTALAGLEARRLEDDGTIRVVALQRLGVSQLPKAGVVIQEGDVLFLAVAGERIDDVDAKLAAVAGNGAGH